MLVKKSSKEQMRTCHISTLHQSTDNRIFRKECCSLVKAGYEVHFIVPTNESAIREGVHIHHIPRVKSRLLRMLFVPWVAAWKALRTRSSLYHYHDPEFLFMGFLLRWVLGKKVIFDIHESVPLQIMSKPYLPLFTRKAVSLGYRFIERLFITGQTLIVANKNSVSAYPSDTYLVQNYPLFNKDLVSVSIDGKQKSKVPMFVYVGAVDVIRGAEIYVELAGKLAERGSDLHMTIVGPDPHNCTRKLKSRAKDLNVEDKVLFTGQMDWVDAMKIVSEATIGLCLLLPEPNFTTCLATKILEYMMFGTPTLVSNFDVWRPYVEAERAGMMADPTNIDEIVEVCEKMLSDQDELIAMGQRGMLAVRNKYNWSSEFDMLLRCYESLIEK